MKADENNPISNKLMVGLNDTDILKAVSESGYSLQTIIANILRDNFEHSDRSFHVQEEWSYIDRDTNQLRTIDILAENELYDFRYEQPRVRPILDLLIECKRADLPFIFFLSTRKPRIPHFPFLVGLGNNEISIITDDDASTWNFLVSSALGLTEHPFITKPAYCMSFTKCVRKSKDVKLEDIDSKEVNFSGSEAYNGLVLPLLKAMYQFEKNESPVKTAFYFDCHSVISVALLDAPMIGVTINENIPQTILLPWVRIVRHETDEVSDFWHRTKLFAIDCVHKDYFHEYVDKHLMPFAEYFRKKVIKHQEELACGKAFISGMNKDSFHNIEKRLCPVNIKVKIRRLLIILNNILRITIGRKPIGE